MTDEQRNDWRQVRVTFRKSLSDGNYGTESAEVMLEDWVTVEDRGRDGDIAMDLLRQARELVHLELGQSPSTRVRSALQDARTAAITAVTMTDSERL